MPYWSRVCPQACVGSILATFLFLEVQAFGQPQSPVDLTQMQIEDLMNMKVTSVQKKEESLARTAAAVFVITQEDIRRSGATNLADVLRMAPGVDVEQINASTWAISIRGFNSRYSDKVLVLIDGRSVYTASFSGVFWEQIDMPLENIERIEVIRGPGASVWGANAMNGVISIITKPSKDTKGGLVSAATGSQLRGQGLTQVGGSLGANATYRTFGSAFDIGNAAGAGQPADDHWYRLHGGARIDWDLSTRDSLMVQGDVFDNSQNQTRRSNDIPTPYDTFFNQASGAAGGDAMARWTHAFSGGSQTSLQSYYDGYRRTDLGIPETGRTFDLDFQDHLASQGRNDIVWGLGYRIYNTCLAKGYAVGFSAACEKDSLFSGFFQDEVRLANSLWFTVGARLDHNATTGFEVEPSLRLAWNPNSGRHTLWASASKAVRQPSRNDTDVQVDIETVPIAPGAIEVLHLSGNPKIKDEEARDYELGYRAEFAKSFSLDVATFLTFYHHLQTVEAQTMQILPGNPMVFQMPMQYDNKAHAVDYGGEVFLNWFANSRWHIRPGYSYLHATLRQDSTSQGFSAYPIETQFPQNMFDVRSQFNISRRMEFDQSLYYTARLPGGIIPGHARLDLRLARRLGEAGELSIVGQNLLRPKTLEYGDSYSVLGTQAVRAIYGKITWRF